MRGVYEEFSAGSAGPGAAAATDAKNSGSGRSVQPLQADLSGTDQSTYGHDSHKILVSTQRRRHAKSGVALAVEKNTEKLIYLYLFFLSAPILVATGVLPGVVVND